MQPYAYFWVPFVSFVAGFSCVHENLFSQDTVSTPNIVLILTDDQGYGDVGRHQNPVLKTPNMDRLHDEGIRFSDFQVSPCCAPTRCALLTGMHEFKSGVTHTIEPFRRMNLKSTTLPQVLQRAGYKTGQFGKWHLGHNDEHRPDKRGFDVGLMVKGDDQASHFDPVLERNGVEEKHQGYRTDILFSEAMKFIEENQEEKFFCYLPTYSPHTPNKVPEQYSLPYQEHEKADFFGQIACIDENIGRLLRSLEKLSLDQQTLVILINDNGGTMGVDTWNAGMRGCKGTPWYGGTRALSFWRWPGTFQPRQIDHLAAHLDVLPTLAEIAGVELMKEHRDELDGKSLLPLLKDPAAAWPQERMLFTNVARWGSVGPDAHAHHFAGVRRGKYHLVTNRHCNDIQCKNRKCQSARRFAAGKGVSMYSQTQTPLHFALTPPEQWALYQLDGDPGENHDVSDEHPELVKEMVKAYDRWWTETRPRMIHHPQ